jgi:hypothetical protein
MNTELAFERQTKVVSGQQVAFNLDTVRTMAGC